MIALNVGEGRIAFEAFRLADQPTHGAYGRGVARRRVRLALALAFGTFARGASELRKNQQPPRVVVGGRRRTKDERSRVRIRGGAPREDLEKFQCSWDIVVSL